MPQVTFNGTKINVEFTESSSRQQLNSGENISTLFGKIKKIFSDLKAVCFSGSYNDLSNKPSSLPANGGNADYATNAGNADTVDGMHADSFIYPRAMLSNVDLNTIFYPCSALIYNDCINMPPVNSWGTLLCYSGGTGSHVQLWVSALDSVMYKRHYDGTRWSEWKEISTTPIKSTTFSGTTGNSGNMVIWATSERKIPLFAEIVDCYCFPFLSSSDAGCYMIHAFDASGDKKHTAVSGTVYYIEI